MFTHKELQRFNRAVLAVHTSRTPDDFPLHLLQMLRCVVAADIAVVDWAGAVNIPVRTLYDPGDAISGDVNTAVHRHLDDNPMYGKRQLAASSISDHLTRRQWHRTALYGEAYAQVGQEDGLALDIPLGGAGFLSLNVTRGQRGFASSERLALSLLGPHVREVYRRLQGNVRLARALDLAHAGENAAKISARESDVLRWVTLGKSNAEIADLLGIRPGTVKRHLENLYAKLGVQSRHQLPRQLAQV
ncbi:LuxR family transcriptional regulator [Pseudolysobacter antarcticus]|uniref:LuxR family transcriptional regulator n=1 Tax=Pseudolysobacter antarcticus TaxID=2511995 RepID=A0A411HHV3_9GAMM|nr:helix-turn-helix transcriptional regulator [Pseudolysobacter antarcticus]QBB69984.1 LuxR family transcriptional regulator [Pseudolysobacter antarcticus]